MNPFLAAQLNTQFVPGVGHVEAGNPSAGVGALGDDSSIMMISGLGAVSDPNEGKPGYRLDSNTGTWRATGQTHSIMVDIQKWWTMVPWYVWVLIAIGALSAGAYLFRNLKKG